MILNKFTFAFFAILFNGLLFSQTNTAIVNLVDFNTSATYGPGSGISVHFNPTGIYKFDSATDDNQFILELSQPGGAFTPPIVISSVNAFFTTTINGAIPAGIAPGTYNIRVKATKGMLADGSSFGDVLSLESAAFDIVSTASTPVVVYSGITPSTTHFDCTTDENFDINPMFGSLSLSTGETSAVISQIKRKLRISNYDNTITYKLKRIDAISSSITDLGIIAGTSHTIVDDLPIGSYNFEIEAEGVSGVSSIYTAIFVLHKNTTVLANESSETICVNSEVVFSIDVSNSGIGLNYRGSYYTLDFGDGTPTQLFTQAEILFNNELLHEYDNVSCTQDEGEFTVEEKLFNKYSSDTTQSCVYQEIGNGAIKKVNTSLAPEAFFEAAGGVDEICENQDINIENLVLQYLTSVTL